ncbi:hypothetical protein HQQ80_20810 [Microbacteriaceae bacterium VKM Ac-2855]|nr:hypothetical protein [Microbacteriaceae bacterium VKM Ac-2855]
MAPPAASEPRTPDSPIRRRTVASGVAWAVPTVAVAIAAPAAAASTAPVFDSPTAYVTGTLTATGTAATPRSALYSGGALSYNSAGTPGQNSGNISLTFYNNKPATWATVLDVAAYTAAGWIVVSADPVAQRFVFFHPAISNGASVTMPVVSWTAPVGSSKPVLGILVESDSDDVSGLGLQLS